MKRLTDVEPETTVVVKSIEGEASSAIKASLSELGIEEGVELTLMAVEPVHTHVGPISLKVGDRESILCQGWADKVFVEKGGEFLPFLMLEKGDKGIVRAIEGGKDFKDWVAELGIEEGSEIEFLRHIPHETLTLKIDDKETKIGPGKASRVWVEDEAKMFQLNYLEQGKKAKVSRITGGARHKQEMGEMGLKEGTKVALVGMEVSKIAPQRKGNYVVAKIGAQAITIGRGMAEKIWVE
jgi:Fe2+ transport system protein FeoA